MTTPIEIELYWRYHGADRDNTGYRMVDYFAGDTLARAESAETIEQCHAIMTEGYAGPDQDGIGVGWIMTWDGRSWG